MERNSQYGNLQGMVDLWDMVQSQQSGFSASSPQRDQTGEISSPEAKVTNSRAVKSNDSNRVVSPATFYKTHLAETPYTGTTAQLRSKRVLLICDRSAADAGQLPPEWASLLFTSNDEHSAKFPSVALNGREMPLPEALASFSSDAWDSVLIAIDHGRSAAGSLLGEDLGRDCGLLNSAFYVAKHFREAIERGSLHFGVVTYNGPAEFDTPSPLTGLFGGFVKSLSRDFPQAVLRAVHSDSPFKNALELMDTELGRENSSEELPEVFYQGSRRLSQVLVPTVNAADEEGKPLIDENSLVIATGGGRGVTAVLMEALVERYNCQVIALGRTQLAGVPPEVLAMDPEELAQQETSFYRKMLEADPGTPILELKRRFSWYSAANEIAATERRISAYGRYEYMAVDLTDPAAVSTAVSQIQARLGDVSLVVHGAGTQISKSLGGKSVEEFDSVVGAKLRSLRNLHSAIQSSQPGKQPHYHILTSAFSFWGNDGQPDYGAANEALNRLTAALSTGGSHWSSLAWLGWAGIGMTRGSEYAALAEQRRLYPVPKEEGQALFLEMFSPRPSESINVLATPSEIDFYSVPVQDESQLARDSVYRQTIDLSSESSSYLDDHIVRGIPTMPGAVELSYSVYAALQASGCAYATSITNARFIKFLKRSRYKTVPARIDAKVIERGSKSSIVEVRVLSDFLHKSGLILQRDIVHFSARVTVTNDPPVAQGSSEIPRERLSGQPVPDPYVSGRHPVVLRGGFDCLRDVRLGDTHRSARAVLGEQIKHSPGPKILASAIVFDALCRLSVIQSEDGKSETAVYVPLEAAHTELYFDYSDRGSEELLRDTVLVAVNPRPHPKLLGHVIIDDARAYTKSGRLLIQTSGVVAKTLV